MARWFTSDHHFGHEKPLVRDLRAFASLDDMHEAMVSAWNSVVRADDEVWVLGDFAVPSRPENLNIGLRLNGKKVLVPGNHDSCWSGKFDTCRSDQLRQRIGEQMQYTRGAGFDRIVDAPAILEVGGVDVQVSHFPYTADHTPVARHMDHRPQDFGGWLIHGHLHEMWRQHDRQINVGVDAWMLRLVHEDELAALIHAGPADRQALPSPHLGPSALAEIERHAEESASAARSEVPAAA